MANMYCQHHGLSGTGKLTVLKLDPKRNNLQCFEEKDFPF